MDMGQGRRIEDDPAASAAFRWPREATLGTGGVMSGDVALPGPAETPDWYLAFGSIEGRLKIAAGMRVGDQRVRYERALSVAGTAESVGLLIAAVLLGGYAIYALRA
jgi:hypothetical protein